MGDRDKDKRKKEEARKAAEYNFQKYNKNDFNSVAKFDRADFGDIDTSKTNIDDDTDLNQNQNPGNVVDYLENFNPNSEYKYVPHPPPAPLPDNNNQRPSFRENKF